MTQSTQEVVGKKVEESSKNEAVFISLEGDVEIPGFKCLSCFDMFTTSEMRGKPDVCPNCGEENIAAGGIIDDPDKEPKELSYY